MGQQNKIDWFAVARRFLSTILIVTTLFLIKPISVTMAFAQLSQTASHETQNLQEHHTIPVLVVLNTLNHNTRQGNIQPSTSQQGALQQDAQRDLHQYSPSTIQTLQDDFLTSLQSTLVQQSHRSSRSTNPQRGTYLDVESAVFIRYKHLPILGMDVDVDTLAIIAESPYVIHVQENRPVTLLSNDASPYGHPVNYNSIASSRTENEPQNLQIIGIPTIWADGYRGAGQVIALIDTGVQVSHPYFFDNPATISGGLGEDSVQIAEVNRNRIVHEACFSAAALCREGQVEDTGPGANVCEKVEDCGHGTHVAGIMVGQSQTLDTITQKTGTQKTGTQKTGIKNIIDPNAINPNTIAENPEAAFAVSGIAPEADVIAIQTLFGEVGFESDIIRGLEYVYELRNTYNIAAVNMSVGRGLYSNPAICDQNELATKIAIDKLYAVNIPVIVATGNNGWSDRMLAPACISTSISVAATDLEDEIPSFNNTTYFTDLLAPGTQIRSATPNRGIDGLPENLYEKRTGTSMASPHVAATWVLLKSRNPALKITEALSLLRDTGISIQDTRSGVHMPRIQADVAMAEIEYTHLEVALVAMNRDAVETAAIRLGETVSYQMVITNPTATDAMDVDYHYILPAHTTLVQVSGQETAGIDSLTNNLTTDEYIYHQDEGIITWLAQTIPAHTTVTYTIHVQMPTNPQHLETTYNPDLDVLQSTLLNTIQIITPEHTLFTRSLETILQLPQIELALSVSNPMPIPGEQVTMTIALTSDSTIDGLTLWLPLPIGAESVGPAEMHVEQIEADPLSETGSETSGQAANPPIVVHDLQLQANQSILVHIPVRIADNVNNNTQLIGTATLNGQGIPSLVESVEMNVRFTDLALSQQIQPIQAQVGQPLTYTISVYNQGSEDATNAVVHILFPADTEIVAIEPYCQTTDRFFFTQSTTSITDLSGVIYNQQQERFTVVECLLTIVPHDLVSLLDIVVIPSEAGVFSNHAYIDTEHLSPKDHNDSNNVIHRGVFIREMMNTPENEVNFASEETLIEDTLAETSEGEAVDETVSGANPDIEPEKTPAIDIQPDLTPQPESMPIISTDTPTPRPTATPTATPTPEPTPEVTLTPLPNNASDNTISLPIDPGQISPTATPTVPTAIDLDDEAPAIDQVPEIELLHVDANASEYQIITPSDSTIVIGIAPDSLPKDVAFIRYTKLLTPTTAPPDTYLNTAFQLDLLDIHASPLNPSQDVLLFTPPLFLTLHYNLLDNPNQAESLLGTDSEELIPPMLNQEEIQLFVYTPSSQTTLIPNQPQWQPLETLSHDTENNVLAVAIEFASEFALVLPSAQTDVDGVSLEFIYLPAIFR
ncbi:MAG: S8 family serine peptidase [Chloroflexota bacterium]